MPTTNYNEWVLHLHLGKAKTPLTVYPTSRKDRVSVWHGSSKWEMITLHQAEIIVGRVIMACNGQVSM